MTEPRILVVGAGAIGCTLGGWLEQTYPGAVTLLARGSAAEAIRANGLTCYLQDHPDKRERVKPRVVTSLAGEALPDLTVITVKNYQLQGAAEQVAAAFGRGVPVIGLQNGLENQQILPRFFDTVIYGVAHYNAWLDTPGVAGALRKGPLVLAARPPQAAALEKAAEWLHRALPLYTTDRVDDAVVSKLVLNLTNSLMTLIDFPARQPSDRKLLQKLVTTFMAEGVAIARAAGYHEFKVPPSPTWPMIRAGAALPRFLTKRMFERNMAKLRLNSMAQDIRKGVDDTELDSLNGPLLAMADKHGLPVPVNRAVYRLCKERFAEKPFVPMGVKEVWAATRSSS